MSKCPACSTELDPFHYAIIGAAIEKDGGWERFEGTCDFPTDDEFHVPGVPGALKIVGKLTNLSGLCDRYGELPQGETHQVYIIFQMSGRFFRKEGEGDSYGRIAWNGPFREVFAKPVTVIEYGPKD